MENSHIPSLLEMYSLFSEDVFSDVVKKYPELESQLQTAKSKGVLPKYFPWLGKMLSQSQEPVEDIISLLLAFEKKQMALKAKFGGQSADINAYKSPAELSGKLELLGSGTKLQSTGGNYDVIYEDDTWFVAMPRTTEESCKLGSGTTWCTARTQSQNLFLSYTARNENIFLFYVINKKENPRSNPDSKLSIGFINGNPQWDEDGGLSVNAANHGLSSSRFEEIVGVEKANNLLGLMRQKIASTNGKHPAQQEIDKLVQNLEMFQKKMDSFKGFDEKLDFIQLALQNPKISDSVVSLLSRDDNREILYMVKSYFQKLPAEKLGFFLSDPNISPYILRWLAKEGNAEILLNIAKNPSTPKDMLDFLSHHYSKRIAYSALKNPSLVGMNLEKILELPEEWMQVSFANDSDTPSEILVGLSRRGTKNVRIQAILNDNFATDEQSWLKLARDPHPEIRRVVAWSSFDQVINNILLDDPNPSVRAAAKEKEMEIDMRQSLAV